MTYKEFEQRKTRIGQWFDGYIKETFVTVKQFGHLEKYHINKDDEFLKNRCKRLKRDISTFIGRDEDIVSMLIDCILENREELIEYIADTDDCDVWELIGEIKDPVKGISYSTNLNHDWKQGALECQKFKIAFKKNELNANCIVITSAYPF